MSAKPVKRTPKKASGKESPTVKEVIQLRDDLKAANVTEVPMDFGRNEPSVEIDVEDIKALVEINPNRLAFELQRQASIYLKFALAAADLGKETADAKNRIEVARAKAGSNIRSAPELFGLAKSTDKAVEEAVILDPGYQAALKDCNNQRWLESQMNAAVQAMEHKKRVIEGYIKLHGQGMFAEPSTEGGPSKATEDQLRKIAARTPPPTED